MDDSGWLYGESTLSTQARPEVIILDNTGRNEDQEEAEHDHDDAARERSQNATNAIGHCH